MSEIFLSFKNLDERGRPSADSELAREVFNHLTGLGLDVFFSEVSLERMGVSAYKAAIDDALDRATTLIAVGTSRQNLESQWVKHEWDSFLNEILSGVKPFGRVFVYVDGMTLKDLPFALRQSQVFNRADAGLERLASFVLNAGASRYTPAESTPIDRKSAEPPELPAAPRSSDINDPFMMPIEEVSIKRRGPARVTGRIQQGICKPGDEVEIVGAWDTPRTIVVGIEIFGKVIEEGRAGDNVILLLSPLREYGASIGNVVARPGSMRAYRKFRAEVCVLPERDGGRGFRSGYIAHYYFRNRDTTGTVTLPAGIETVRPGDVVQLEVELSQPVAMNEGLPFAIRLAQRSIATGKVTTLME